VTIATLAAQPLPATMPIEQVRALVAEGSLPPSALEKARDAAADRQDQQTLRETLYSFTRIEDTTEEQAIAAVGAAQRRLDRKLRRAAELRILIDQGVSPRNQLDALNRDIADDRQTLTLAQSRADLLKEIVESARREAEVAQAAQDASTGGPVQVRFDGAGVFGPREWGMVSSAYERHFGVAMPVSANGDTAVHRAMGFDHRGRIDVALNPDQAEGAWLRHYLEQHGIPYYAFRAAVAGRATAPHIHIGPPSLRLHAAD
jgi:hypothetical protein